MPAVFSILFLFLCAVVAFSALRSTVIADASDDRVSRFLKGAVIFFTVFFGAFHMLGFIDLVTNLPVVSALYACAAASIVLAVLVIRPGKARAALAIASRRRAGIDTSLSHVEQGGNRLISIVSLITLVTIGLIALMLMAAYPDGWEASAYHLPVGVQIFQDQSLKLWDTAFVHSYPANASIYFGFLLKFLPEHAVSATNLVFLLPLFFATYGLGRATGADQGASLLAAIGLLSIPIVIFPAFQAEADTGGAAFAALAAYFVIAKSDRLDLNAFLAGLAAGLAYGFKQVHAMSAAFVFLVILANALGKPGPGAVPRRILRVFRPAAIFLLAAFATSSFWLIRSYVEFGNPLYPVYFPGLFDLFGFPRAPDYDYAAIAQKQSEYVRSPLEWPIYPWVERHFLNQNFKASAGLGAFFAATVPVAALAAVVGCLTQRRERRVLFCLLGGGTFILTAWWILNARVLTYVLGALVMLVPLVAWAIGQSSGMIRKAYELVCSLAIAAMFFVIFTKQLIGFGDRIIYSQMYTRPLFYEYPAGIDRLPPNSRIANLAARLLNYHLFGDGHGNRVVSFLGSTQRFVIGAPPQSQLVEEWPPSTPIALRASTLRESGVTHLYTHGLPSLSFDGCAKVEEIDRLEFNPLNGLRMPKPYAIYEIRYCDEM